MGGLFSVPTPSRPPSSRGRLWFSSLLAATCLTTMPTLAAAQATPVSGEADAADAGDASTITVTATRRITEEVDTAQKKVSSTSVIGADQLERLGVLSTLDIANLTPNLYQPRNTMSYSAAQYFIRGIGELDAQGEPSVGTFIDGVYVTRNLGAMQELLDVESIQVDRGPVIGVSHVVEGGAVRITSLVPDNDLRVQAEAGYGSLNEWKVGALVSGPLVKDKIYASFAISHHGRDGTDYNTTLNRKVNNIDITQARAKLRFTPNDRLDFTLSVNGTLDYSTNRGYGNLLNPNKFDLIAPIYPHNRFAQLGFTASTTYEFNDNLKLYSITAYRGFNDNADYENTGDRFARNSAPLYYNDQAYSQDLYLKGTSGPVDYTLGVYGLYEYWLTNRNVNASRTIHGTPDTIIYTPINAYIVQKNYNLSAYGEANVHLSDTLTLTAGLRLNWEKHKTAETLSYLIGGGDHTLTVTDVSQMPAVLAALYSQPQSTAWQVAASQDWTQLLPRAGLSWEFRPDVRAYASIGQGSKSAGYDFRAASGTAAGAGQASTPYNPERVTTYEIGLKTQPSSGVRLNGAVFYNQFQNIQISAYDPVTALTRRFNAGKAHSWGVEGEANLTLTPQWTLDATASYLYTRLDEYWGTPTRLLLSNGDILPTAAYVGAPLPNAPRFQGRAATQYRIPLGSAGSISLGGDVSYQAATYLTSAASAYNRMPPETFLNASIGWTSPDERWSVTLYARNLLDKRYLVWRGFSTSSGSPAYPIFDTASFTDPRTVFASLKWHL
ncbi:MAG TPA: TonB-dependent receptor [Sphingobium sp.]|uniref:TonB-dependent receptor n=1 Tax=Sphingobium sp. TaxID=1912891 RepID=UPI002ED3C2C0